MSILLATVSIGMTIVCYFKSNNRIFTNALLIFMWFLFAFSSETADYQIYSRRFYQNYRESTEPLFNLLVKLFNALNLKLEIYIFFVATVFMICLRNFLYNKKINRKNSSFPLVLYFIYPFCMELTQLRSTIGFIPILIGINFLLSEKKADEFKFLICVIIASFFHYSYIFCILFFLCKKVNIKQTILITGICITVFALLKNIEQLMLSAASKIGAYNKVWTVLNNITMKNQHTIHGTQKMMIVTFLLIITILIWLYKTCNTPYLEFIIKINILLLILIPLLNYAVDLFRIQRYLLVFTYAAFASYLRFKSDDLGKYSLRGVLFRIVCLSVPLCGLYLNVLRSNLFETVLVPIFNSNLLFNLR